MQRNNCIIIIYIKSALQDVLALDKQHIIIPLVLR
jgi:hypothetical protein